LNALHKHWQRLTELLPAEIVADLREQYRQDAAIDGAASRQRTKQRQAAKLAAWEAEQAQRERGER
jgi:hypothetical protein